MRVLGSGFWVRGSGSWFLFLVPGSCSEVRLWRPQNGVAAGVEDFSEGRRLGMERLWVHVLLNLLVGVSFALPVFLYVREGKIEQAT